MKCGNTALRQRLAKQLATFTSLMGSHCPLQAQARCMLWLLIFQSRDRVPGEVSVVPVILFLSSLA